MPADAAYVTFHVHESSARKYPVLSPARSLARRMIGLAPTSGALAETRQFTVIGSTDEGEEIAILSRVIELHDRSGTDFDRISDRTDGKSTQAVKVEAQALILPPIVLEKGVWGGLCAGATAFTLKVTLAGA